MEVIEELTVGSIVFLAKKKHGKKRHLVKLFIKTTLGVRGLFLKWSFQQECVAIVALIYQLNTLKHVINKTCVVFFEKKTTTITNTYKHKKTNMKPHCQVSHEENRLTFH